MKALIMIDIQNDFCPGGSLAVKDGDMIVPLVNTLQPFFELVAATQDWHPLDHKSFASNHEGKKPGDLINLKGIQQVLWPVHCVQGSFGAELLKELDKNRIEQIFHKGTDPDIDSYSGFFDNNHRKSTELNEYLKKGGVKDVYIVGLATDYCVKYTALDAHNLGFNTFVIKDACKGVELRKGDTEQAVAEMEKTGINVIKSDDILVNKA